jgi:DNA-directed RNA polymerase I, II, and III subunit RPABC5
LKVTADLWERYIRLVEEQGVMEGYVFALGITRPTLGGREDGMNLTLDRDALDQLGCKRYCCRRMVLTHVDLIEKLLK